MDFAIIFVCTTLACFVLRTPIKACPMLFYVLAVAVDVLFVAGAFFPLPQVVWSTLLMLVQKCMLALALFAVVMFIGVFARDSRAGQWLRPIRAELSTIAWLLSLGHMAVYLAAYVPRLGSAMQSNVLGAFAVALVLFVLLLGLGVTSFNVVKKRMRTDTWKRVQRWAYPLFGLVYVHLLLMLLPSALHGGAAAQMSMAVYTTLFVAYTVFRLRRALLDWKHTVPSVASGVEAV